MSNKMSKCKVIKRNLYLVKCGKKKPIKTEDRKQAYRLAKKWNKKMPDWI